MYYYSDHHDDTVQGNGVQITQSGAISGKAEVGGWRHCIGA